MTTSNERLKESKVEAVDYKIPNSEIVVAKFITYPSLNDFNELPSNWNISTALMTSVSPFKAANMDAIFDGG